MREILIIIKMTNSEGARIDDVLPKFSQFATPCTLQSPSSRAQKHSASGKKKLLGERKKVINNSMFISIQLSCVFKKFHAEKKYFPLSRSLNLSRSGVWSVKNFPVSLLACAVLSRI
jgi:hypothetical protein